MIRFLMMLVLILFPMTVSAKSVVGKWTLAKKKTHDAAVSAIKQNKSIPAKHKKMLIKLQASLLKTEAVLTFGKNGKYTLVSKAEFRKKFYKKTEKGSWKSIKGGVSYTSSGRFPTTRTCKVDKEGLRCTLLSRGSKKVTFYTKK